MFLKRILPTLTLSLWLALPALAETPPADNATIPGKGARLSEVLVTATRHESKVDMVPNAVTVITREQIDKMVAPTAIDILKNAAGVDVYNARGPISSSTYNRVIMRGMGATPAHVLVMINGIPQSDVQQQSFEWSFINPNDIERIEVVRGPGSALYGAQAMGGVINIILKKPGNPEGEGRVGAKWGSLDTVEGNAAYSQKSGDWGFYGSGLWGQTSGYRVSPNPPYSAATNRALRSRKESGMGSVSYDIDPTSSLLFNARYSHFANHGTYSYNPDFLAFEMARYIGEAKYEKKFEGAEFSAYASLGQIRSNYANAGKGSATGDAPAIQRDYNAGANLGVEAGSFNYITVGADAKRFTYDRRNNNWATGTDAYGSSGGDQLGWGVFAQDEITLFDKRLIIVPGARFDYVSLFQGYNEQRANNIYRTDMANNVMKAITSRIGARYNALPWLSLRSAYGQAFRAPNLGELYGRSTLSGKTYWGNPDLKPEHMSSVEAGFDLTPLDSLRLGFTYYKSHTSNFINLSLISADTYLRKNIGVVDIGGFEAEAEYSFLDYWRAFTNYQACDPKLMNGVNAGQRITGTPMSSFSAGMGYSNPNLFNASLTSRTVGRIYNNDNNTSWFGRYTTVDAKISKTFSLESSNLEVALEGSNILGAEISETGNTRAPGRMVYLSTTYHF